MQVSSARTQTMRLGRIRARLDAGHAISTFASMVVYTVATVAFFNSGSCRPASDGARSGWDANGQHSVAEAYVPVFGEYAKWLFLVGAIVSVLNISRGPRQSDSTYTDGMKIWGAGRP
ncbi:MAG: hypothetical protein R3C02_21535 [Planctomycetaceae bacterium]